MREKENREQTGERGRGRTDGHSTDLEFVLPSPPLSLSKRIKVRGVVVVGAEKEFPPFSPLLICHFLPPSSSCCFFSFGLAPDGPGTDGQGEEKDSRDGRRGEKC